MVEGRVGIDVECSMIVCQQEVVASVLFQDTVVGMMFRDIVVIGRLCMMAWFETWKDRLALCGIVRMNFGQGSLQWGLVIWCMCEWAWLMGFGEGLGKKVGGRIEFVGF